MTSQLDTVIDCANIAMNCDHTADPVGMVCWTCAMKMVSIAEAAEADNAGLRGMLRDEIMRAEDAEAALQAVMTRAAQLEAELKNAGEAYTAKVYTVTELQRIVSEVTAERGEAIRQLEQARKVCAYWLHNARFFTANTKEKDEAVEMLKGVVGDPH